MDGSTDKTARSIFVGNIPYEATEEKLMALFGQAGPVNGFRLVYDRESGKPKGYGFCEYDCAEVAQSALRNLNNIDFNGRPLRIGPAAGEQNSAEVAMSNNTLMRPPEESQYGEKCDPSQSLSNINQIVSSLHPEMMYQLIVELKQMLRDNPEGSRKFFKDQPQLMYAILQVQIRMKMITPEKANSMLCGTLEEAVADMPVNHIRNNVHHPQMLHYQGDPRFKMPHQPHMPYPNQQPMMHPPMSPGNMFSQPIPPHHMMPPNYMSVPQGTTGMPMNMNIPPQLPKQPKMEESLEFCNDLSETQKLEALDMMKAFNSQGEKERAALIFQVLRLTDAQVALLPEDQRKSINSLKNQLKEQK